MAACLGYTLRMRTLFRGWPIMVNYTHTRRRRRSKYNHFITTACRSGTPGFSRRKIPHSSTCTISEKAIWFRCADYDPDRAQKLISSSMSWHLSAHSISSKSMHTFLSNLANRQTDRHGQSTSSFVGGKLVPLFYYNSLCGVKLTPGTASLFLVACDA